MKVVKIEFLVQEGHFQQTTEFENILKEIQGAISAVTHPAGSQKFTLYPVKNANGVVPIKKLRKIF